jgi:hypothetical protein
METYRLKINDESKFHRCNNELKEIPIPEGSKIIPISPGEVQVTLNAVNAVRPGEGVTYLAAHSVGVGLSADELDNRQRVVEEKFGRHYTEWEISPIMAVNKDDGSMFCLNARFLGERVVFLTSADESLTVMCLKSEVPKAGLPGPGIGAPCLTPEIQHGLPPSGDDGWE